MIKTLIFVRLKTYGAASREVWYCKTVFGTYYIRCRKDGVFEAIPPDAPLFEVASFTNGVHYFQQRFNELVNECLTQPQTHIQE